MFLLLWAYMDAKVADHMITKKQRTSHFFATYMVLYYTCSY